MISKLRPSLVLALAVAGAGCSFVFGDEKYIDNDAEIPFDTGAGDADAGDGGDGSDGAMDGDASGDGATGCLADPTLCTDGTRCADDGRCVACDADGDGAFAPDETCDAMAGDAPRDCDDDDGEVYPGAAPVCGDGKINGCEAGPAPVLGELGVAELGSLGSERITPLSPGDDLWSLAFDVTVEDGATAPYLLVAWATDSEGGRFYAADAEDLSRVAAFGIGIDTVGLDLRRTTNTEAVIRALQDGATTEGRLTTIGFDATDPTTLSPPRTYAFDDGPCASAAEAGDLVGDLAVDADGGATWLLGGSDRAVWVSSADAVTCIAVPAGDHRIAGTDSAVVAMSDPADGRVRVVRGAADAVDDIDAAAVTAARDEQPGFAFVRAAAADLHLAATVQADGRTRVVPVECVAGGACAPSATPGAVFDPPAGVAETYGAAVDGLTGDHVALVQIEERGSAPAPDDRAHDVVLRVLEYPNVAIGGDGASAPGASVLLYRHGYVSADRDHAEVREVEVATRRDPTTGDLTVYWAALIGDRRLAPGATEDPDAENEIRYGGVRLCVSE